MKRLLLKLILAGTVLTLLLVGTAGTVALAAPPDEGNEKGIFFICPSVSLKNAKGMWVLGDHGAYYVRVPTKGGKHEGSKVYVRVPVHVTDKAQIPAGWGLYKDYPSYPYFSGDDPIMLLEEGLIQLQDPSPDPPNWVVPSNWGEGDILMVTDNGDGSYTVTNYGPMMAEFKGSITIWVPIPLFAAVFW